MGKSDILGDIFGTLTGQNKAPDAPGMVGLDPQAQATLDSSIARSMNPDDGSNVQIAKDASSSLVPSMEKLNQKSAQIAQDPYFDEAAMRYAQGKYNKKAQRYGETDSIQSDLQKSQQMARMSQAALGQQRAKDQNYAFLTDIYNQQEAARAQFVNGIFQTGAYAAGAFGDAKNKKKPVSKEAGTKSGNYGYITSEDGHDS